MEYLRGGSAKLCGFMDYVGLMDLWVRGFVGYVSQKVTWLERVAWVKNVLAWVLILAWVQNLA